MFEMIRRNPDRIVVRTETEEFRGSISSGSFSVHDICVETAVNKEGVAVTVTAMDSPLTLIRLRWNLESPLCGKFLGDAWERGYGDMSWESMVPNRAMPWYFLIHKDGETAGYGVKVRPGALCFFQADPKGITLWMDVRNGGSGVLLSGRTLEACTLVCADFLGMSAFQAARSFCAMMCTDGIFPDKPVYGSNNWYYAYGVSSREEILNDTDYLMSMTEEAKNPPFMVIDDCWQLNRCPDYIGGPWIPNDRFGDMKTLADAIKEKGARPGIWVRFLYDKSEDIPKEQRLASGFLDPSHPAVLSHVADIVKWISGWGYELIKHDFTTFDIFGKWGFQMQPLMTDDGWHFYDRSKTSAEIVVELYRTILEAAKPYGTLILGCNTIGHLGAGLMHMNRTGDDTSGRYYERSIYMGVNTLAFRMQEHRIFFDVDADCVGIMETLPWSLNRNWSKLVAASGSSMFVSPKPGVLREEEKAELAAHLLENSEQKYVAEPLDWMETTQPMKWQVGDEILTFDWYEEDGLNIAQRFGCCFNIPFAFAMSDNLW